jgi:hypothetical protein
LGLSVLPLAAKGQQPFVLFCDERSEVETEEEGGELSWRRKVKSELDSSDLVWIH